MSLQWKDFQGVNAGFALELYERFRENPQSVDEATRRFFETWTPPVDSSGNAPIVALASGAATPVPSGVEARIVVGAVNLAQSIRRYGHLAAGIDPLGSRPQGDPSLLPETHGVTEADLRSLPASLISGPVAASSATMWDVVERRAITVDDRVRRRAHFRAEERRWLREATRRAAPRADRSDRSDAILERLTDVGGLREVPARTFPGKTRFDRGLTCRADPTR